MPQGYHEKADIRTDKAPKHQKAAFTSKNISNAKILPAKKSNNKIRKNPRHSFLLYNAVLDYCRDHFDIDDDVIIETKFRKPKHYCTKVLQDYGNISLLDKTSKHYNKTRDKNIIVVNECSFDITIKHMMHEFTHIKQKLKGELELLEETIMWKNKPFFTKTEYRKLSPKEYVNLPWEVEADKNVDLISDFYKSPYFKNLKGQNPTLDFIIDSEEGLYDPPKKPESKEVDIIALILAERNK